ncbi:MAG: hypothetical protein ACRC5M_02520 [Anaeroplasmataceae bacterium]
MKLKMLLEHDKLQQFKEFSGDFIEVYYSKEISVMSSDSGDCLEFMQLNIISGSEEGFCIRLPKSVISNLSEEAFMDIVVLDSTTKCVFYNKSMSFIYHTIFNRQRGSQIFKDKLEFINSKSNFDSIDTASLSSIVYVFTRLNINVSCIDNVAFGVFNRSYLFKKLNAPNFSIPAKTLRRITSKSDRIYFIENYIYADLGDNGIHAFFSKHRVKSTTDMDFIAKSRFSHTLDLGIKNLTAVTRRYNIDESFECSLNLVDKCINLKSPTSEFKVSIGVENIKSTIKQDSVEINEDELLKSLLSEAKPIDLNIDKNPQNLPNLYLPNWVCKFILVGGDAKMYINTNFIAFSIKGTKVIISRLNKNER